jgi:hypothetical protein
MTGAILVNAIIGLSVFAVIVGMAVWAISTQLRDRVAVVGERRQAPDRRRQAARPQVERRSGDRRYGRAVTA